MTAGRAAKGADTAGDEQALALRAEIERLHAEARRNTGLFQRTLERELSILEARSLVELLPRVTGGLRDSYQLDAVTLALQDPQHELRHLLLGDGQAPEGFDGVLFTDNVLALAPQTRSLPGPWLGPFAAADHALLFPREGSLRSVAILPLRRRDSLVGTLNFGSVDRERFVQGMASDFFAHLAVIVALAIENACNAARLLRAGLTDYLTGWYNQRYLHARLREEVARSLRQGTPLALLMFDLDHFKEVNDSYGHLGGDTALRDVAARVEAEIRRSDVAARCGGDEFAVLLPGTAAAEAALLAERIRQVVSATPLAVSAGQQRTVTVSAGIAVFLPLRGGEDLKSLAEHLMAEADAALYQAKSAGRDRVICSQPPPTAVRR